MESGLPDPGQNVKIGAVQWRRSGTSAGVLTQLSSLDSHELINSPEWTVIKQKKRFLSGRLRTAGGDYFVKVSTKIGMSRLLRSVVRSSPMREEWRKTWWIRSHGIETVEPLAVGEVRAGPILLRNLFICRWIRGAVPLSDYLRNMETALPPRELRHLLQRLSFLLGGLVGSLHAVGAFHRQLHGLNILVLEDSCRDPRLIPIDFQHLTIADDAREKDRHWNFRELAWRLHPPFVEWNCGNKEILHFLRGYKEAPHSAGSFAESVDQSPLPDEFPTVKPKKSWYGKNFCHNNYLK